MRIAVRNLLEPSLRLDRESVNDPIGVRSGIGYVHPVLGGRNLLVALDVEKTADMGARLHAGLEVMVVPSMALRAGMNGGALEAGVALVPGSGAA